MFLYNALHQVIICSHCGSCIIPRRASQEQHLRAKPHQLRGDTLKATLQQFSSYSIRTVEELRVKKPKAEDGVARIKHLAAYDGFHCLRLDCAFYTRRFTRMKEHVAAHTRKKMKSWLQQGLVIVIVPCGKSACYRRTSLRGAESITLW